MRFQELSISILNCYYRFLQDIEYSSLWYTVGPCCLFCIWQSVSVNTKSLIFPFNKNINKRASQTWVQSHGFKIHKPQSNLACALQLPGLCSRAQEPQLLSLHATTTEARVPQGPCSATREATKMTSLCTATRQKPPLTSTREKPAQPEINQSIKLFLIYTFKNGNLHFY